MSFWGVELNSDKVVPYVPPPEQARLHISQACLASEDAKSSALRVKVQDGPELFVCRLTPGVQEFANLDLVLDEYTELTCVGAPIHVTGYLMSEEPQHEEMEEEDDDEMDADFTPEMAEKLRGMITMDGEEDSEEEDSEASDSEDDYDDAYIKGMGIDMGSDDDDDDEEDDDDDSEEDDESDADEFARPSNVVIEEILDGQADDGQITAMTAAKVELPQSQEKAEAKLSKKRKADTAAELPAALESQLQAKPTPTPKQKLAPTPANTPATAAKQKKTGNSAAAAAPASAPAAVTASAAEAKAKKQKTAAAAAAPAESAEAGLSKSQLKKQRKQARVNGEAPAAGAADTPVQAQPVADSAPKKGSLQKWENGFQIERLHVGKPDGKLAKPGKKVIVKYKGTLSNGKVFDETKGNKTFSFRLGVGEVIKGWDRGVAGMRVGDKRKLTVPPQMAYGTGGVKGAGIPPNATLNFNVELVDVK